MTRPKTLVLVSVLTFSLVMGGLSGCSGSQSNAKTDKKLEQTQQTSQTTVPVNEKVGVNAKVHIDQLGYRPEDKKIAVINGKSGKFEVIDENDGKAVLTGETSGKLDDAVSGDTVYYADFSSIQKPGSYYVLIPDYGKSYTFKIENNSYKDVKLGLLKMFYYQRCGMSLDEKYAGLWQHVECHLKDGTIYNTEKTKEATGGWHDAGDYGKYTAAGAASLGYLLMAYELFPEAYKEDTGIPESGNNIPDILDESRYELEWMLKMQDNASGGVYHKLTSTFFSNFVMPDLDIADEYFAPISPTATGGFAAIMAKAARIYQSYDKDFSAKCLKASEKAWSWLVKNPNAPGYKNPNEILTGEYGDENSRDERYWAAAELYRVTGNVKYNEYFKKALKEEPGFYKGGLGWQDVGFMGTITYLFTDESKRDKTSYDMLKGWIVSEADAAVKKSHSDGYGITLGSDDYIWGSNMSVMNGAIRLIIADMISPKKEYVDTAEEHLHYLFGKNTLDQCFVTGFGSKSVKDPHHRPTVADTAKDPVPGMVVGGPDKNREDGYTKGEIFDGVPPARCYGDDPGAYSVNEVAIYWNASAAFVAGYFDR